ncbi:MAG: MBL fold metallo-hydrolase [Betaproteobacteria bacterium]|jgi:Metal-dependent hydrolases of the beta-lactamase superfamily I|nr:MBL fold metallo-hydrolase [Betaproteobacteria bacterium]
MLRFASLGSGSGGNGLLIEQGETLILVDCGFSAAEAERRCQRLGKTLQDLDAILVTHEHSDHIGGVLSVHKKTGCPVHGSFGTLSGIREGLENAQILRDGLSLHLGTLTIQPYAVPHDAREPLQYTVESGRRRLGILTDAGSITPHIENCLQGCHALLIESNYDPQLLESGPYPPGLKARVHGDYGHLSNLACAQLIKKLDHPDLSHIVVAHLSRKNNTTEHVRSTLEQVLGCHDPRIHMADQEQGLDWITV